MLIATQSFASGLGASTQNAPSSWWRHSVGFSAGEQIILSSDVVCVMRSGWVARARLLESGRRQILDVLLPGDRYFTADASTCDVLTALSPCEVARVPAAEVHKAVEESDALRADVAAAAARRRRAVLEERIVSLGRRSALARTAHVFCEFLTLAAGAASATATEGELPLTQADLADLLGLSVVHVNRTLQQLKRMGLAQVGRGRLTVLDREALATLADFSPDYLR